MFTLTNFSLASVTTRRHQPFKLAAVIMTASTLMLGCSTIQEMATNDISDGSPRTTNDNYEYDRSDRSDRADQTNRADRTSSSTRRELNYGYAQLYEVADGLSWLDEALLLKQESDIVDNYCTRLAEEMKEMQQDLDKLSAEIPAMQVDDNGLPVMESRKRAAAQEARIKDLAPFIGRTGVGFERTLLLTLSGTLNQSRYLIQVMDAEETIPPLNQFLDKWRQRIDVLYQRDVEILNEYYFE